MNILKKLLLWVPVILAGVSGVGQACVKFVKEVLTLIVDILFPVISSEKFEEVVFAIRDAVNVIDDLLENLKNFLLDLGVE